MLYALSTAARVWTPTIWILGALFGTIGMIALVSPRLFAKLTALGNTWVDTSRFFAKFDTQVEVDQKVLPHCRWLGAAVVAAVAVVWVTLGR